jgi:GGDEF domain-containing protein
VYTAASVGYLTVFGGNPLVWCVIVALGAVGAAYGVRRSARPAVPAAWRLLPAAMAATTVGVVLITWGSLAGGPNEGGGFQQSGRAFQLLGYAAAAGAVYLMTGRRDGHALVADLADLLIIAGGLFALTMAYLQLRAPGGAPVMTRAVLPVANALVCAMALRLIAAGALRHRPARLLVLGAFADLVSDAIYSGVLFHPTGRMALYACLGHVVCYGLWALAAMDPGARALGAPRYEHGVRLGPWIAVLAASALMGPVSLIEGEQASAGRGVTALTLLSTVLMLLLVARLALLMRERLALAGVVRAHELLADGAARRERELRYLAYHDPLTGLANRRRLFEQLAERLARIRACGEGSVLGVAVLDMDDFKAVNDRYGHEVGDEVITAIGRRLAAGVRGGVSAPDSGAGNDDAEDADPGDLVARLGGDEFAVVLGPAETAAALEAAAHRLAALFAHPFAVSVGLLPATASVGLATTADHAARPPNPQELLRCADLAHYAVKQAGKNGVRRYEPAVPQRGADAGRHRRLQPAFRTPGAPHGAPPAVLAPADSAL